MSYSNSPESMSPVEQHGIQLRIAADKLELAVNDLDTRAAFLVRRVTALRDTEIIRNEIREQLLDTDSITSQTE